MRVFLSWAREPSKSVAHALRQWLPDVLQSLEPWVSSSDIGAGARWSTEIAQSLSSSKIGIVCVTAANQNDPWLVFETGALAKTLEETFVCPYLIGLRPTDLQQGPLTQFQAKVADRAGTMELLETINRALGASALPQERLQRLFDRSWPDLERRLQDLPAVEPRSKRNMDEMIAEVLETVRTLARRIPEGAPIRANPLTLDDRLHIQLRRLYPRPNEEVLQALLKGLADADKYHLWRSLSSHHVDARAEELLAVLVGTGKVLVPTYEDTQAPSTSDTIDAG